MSDDQETPQELEMKVLSVLQHVDESINKDDIFRCHASIRTQKEQDSKTRYHGSFYYC